MSRDKPNILFILSDQQRWDTVECYGRPIFPGLTPNLDQLAADGVMFRNTFTCQPVCGPARSCLQTGQLATRTGCFTNWRGLPAGQRTIAHALAEKGYRPGYLGKWHLGGRWENYTSSNVATAPVPQERRGGYTDYWLAAEALEFTSHGYEGYMYDKNDVRLDFEGYRVDCLTDFALEYLRDQAARDDNSPFFFFLSYIEPHQQNNLDRYIGPMGSKQRFKEYQAPGDLKGQEGFWRKEMPDYLGCCKSLDENVGRILEELDRLGLRENTLVIYTSDHGNHFGTRNGESKRSPHESSIRVPLIIHGPGFQGGKVADELVSLIDLPPTVLAVGGIDTPGDMDGRPIHGLVGGGENDWPEEVFIQISEEGVGRALRTARWKYAVYAPNMQGTEEPGSDRYVERFLYDLEQDPHEWNNRVTDPSLREVRKELSGKLIEWMVKAGENAPVIEKADPN